MGYRLPDAYAEAPLADRDASDDDRDAITRRADRARAWVAACRDVHAYSENDPRPAWQRVER